MTILGLNVNKYRHYILHVHVVWYLLWMYKDTCEDVRSASDNSMNRLNNLWLWINIRFFCISTRTLSYERYVQAWYDRRLGMNRAAEVITYVQDVIWKCVCIKTSNMDIKAVCVLRLLAFSDYLHWNGSLGTERSLPGVIQTLTILLFMALLKKTKDNGDLLKTYPEKCIHEFIFRNSACTTH